MGDLHGAYKAMMQCLERSDFDYRADRLIFLGDVADGWPEVPQCIEEFLKIENRIILKGNHDIWFENFLRSEDAPEHWLIQGGLITRQSYEEKKDSIPRHLKFIETALPYYLDAHNRLFVHAGFNPDLPVERTDSPDEDYYWTRSVFKRSFDKPVMPELYPEIFIGHPPTRGISDKPVHNHNVWLMDQGAAWEGRLSMMEMSVFNFFILGV